MVDRLIKEINKALENNLHIVALNTALTLPDICAKAEFPNEKSNKTRYVKWYEEHIGITEKGNTIYDLNMPYLNGEVIYSLRNCMLHQGTPNIDNNQIKNDDNKINQFILTTTSYDKFDYGDTSSVTFKFGKNKQTCNYSVSVRRLCSIIIVATKNYYDKNKEKFNFFKYQIKDMDNIHNYIKNE